MKSRFPFTSFPNSWFRVAASSEVPPGKVIPLHYFGKDLVLFRTEDGKAHVLDAYCPHLGTHLGHGGKVRENTVECPFHGWQFNGNGHCISIPYASNLPSKAQIRSWPTREVNGMIVVYHDELGLPPTWELPDISEYSSDEWTPWHQIRHWKIHSHVQELLENGVDIAHLPFLHSKGISSVENNTLKIDRTTLSHYVSVVYNLASPFFGILGTVSQGSIDVNSYGLGFQASYLYTKSRLEIRCITLLWITPIDEDYVDVRIVFSMKKIFNNFITFFLEKLAKRSTVKALEEDMPIYEYKLCHSRPVLCEGDGPIMQFRRWASQFYSDIPVTNQELTQR